MIGLWIVLGVILLIGLYVVIAYNGLVRLRNQVNNAWSQIDVQLKRRHDLIPNLVETAKGYMKHEQETLTRITEARNLARGASTVGEANQAESALSSALGQFFVVVENYPDLKANQNFLRLQDELAGTENRIAVERMRYNEAVREYNVYIRRFPTLILANMFGFTRAPLFEAPEEAKEPPKVQF